MRVPLSWLRDFAPFVDDPAVLSAALDDLGLVVEGIEMVGEGLADIVVARIDDVSAIAGADRIRLVVVDAGDGPIDVVCGAANFAVGDLVALAPVGAMLPGGFEIGRRKMKGVTSNGMLCSGRELGLSDDHEGILRLNEVELASVGVPLTEALDIEPDVIFDVTVEANRPDAWSIAGVARDLAARMGVPFAVPTTAELDPSGGGPGTTPGPAEGPPVESLASVVLEDTELCPRFTARVIVGVAVGPSPRWLARRLTLAGMRPINNVVDASNYVMLELGQPTHPYDLDRLDGHGLVIRRATPGESLTTLDGVERVLGRPGPGLGDTGQDCLICDAQGAPVAIGGVMGGASSEIDNTTTRVLLEAAYFVPMAIARTSKRLTLRTEASARFERGCDPNGIDRAARRFCELLTLTGGPSLEVASGVIDVAGEVPTAVQLTVRTSSINGLLGTTLDRPAVIGLLEPLGIGAEPVAGQDPESILVTVPTFRPDIRPAPLGEADIAEEVARTYGYSRIARRQPAWPQPGRLTRIQRDRRILGEVLAGVGCSEAWTATFVSESDQLLAGIDAPSIEVANPLVDAERFLRSSMAPGLVRAAVYNAERRNPYVRLFERGSVFLAHRLPPVGEEAVPPTETVERLCALFAGDGDDAWTAVAAWRTVADALGIGDWVMGEVSPTGPAAGAVHPYRSASLWSVATSPDGSEVRTPLGLVGELSPSVVSGFGLVGSDGRPRRVGWLDLDVDRLLDRNRVPRRPDAAREISRFPSSDVDLAFVVSDGVPAGVLDRTLRRAGGDLLESLELFDVYRGDSVADGSRSLAFRLRFCAADRTLTDQEVGELRLACIEAATTGHGAVLR